VTLPVEISGCAKDLIADGAKSSQPAPIHQPLTTSLELPNAQVVPHRCSHTGSLASTDRRICIASTGIGDVQNDG
jgi:hypothetical protein